MDYKHIPVMLKEVLNYLDIKSGDTVIDCTLGGGGYTREIAKLVGDKGQIIAIDADKVAIQNSKDINKKLLIKNITLVHDNFKNLQKIIKQNRIKKVNAIVFDLGLSSYQLQDQSRGFSFGMDAPLDMSFSQESQSHKVTKLQSLKSGEQKFETIKTTDIVNRYSKQDLIRIIKDYGEERFSGRIAEAIVRARPLHTTKELAEAIVRAVPRGYERGRIHPATRTFQALRIETNQELDNLKEVLPQAIDILALDGRLAVVSFHSLEDRIVKHFFKDQKQEKKVEILTKKPIIPEIEEIKNNPRSRSAKLRAVKKL